MNTICAISTPYGSGGIAVVRVSGTNAIAMVDGLFHARKSLTEAKAYTVHYGEIRKRAVGLSKSAMCWTWVAAQVYWVSWLRNAELPM